MIYFSGLLLGCCLLILVCTISEEFGPASASRAAWSRSELSTASSPLKLDSSMISGGRSSLGSSRDRYSSSKEGSRDQYSYGWSFILATLGFLGSELSALLCLAAFLNRFDSEVRKDRCLCKCFRPFRRKKLPFDWCKFPLHLLGTSSGSESLKKYTTA